MFFPRVNIVVYDISNYQELLVSSVCVCVCVCMCALYHLCSGDENSFHCFPDGSCLVMSPLGMLVEII